MTVTVNAYAKINIILDVVGKKKNGYHDLFSVMQNVSLYDTLKIGQNGSEEITLSSDDADVPTDSSNIVYKCADLFFRKAGITSGKGISVEITKRIPSCAGLGGGSADGAAVLFALNEMFGGLFTTRELCEIAALVGADIPFFLVGGTALVLDTGCVVAPLRQLDDCFVILVKPDEGVSTKEAYAAVDALENIRHTKNDLMRNALVDGDFDTAMKYCGNVFEQAIEVPGRAQIKYIMNSHNASCACMSGSGSTVFGIYKNESDAAAAYDELKLKYKNVFFCKPEKAGIKITEKTE